MPVGALKTEQDVARFVEELMQKPVTDLRSQLSALVIPAGEEGPPGPAGGEGPIGPAGPAGAAGAKGEKGATGEKGAAGEKGATGEKGEKGEAGVGGLPTTVWRDILTAGTRLGSATPAGTYLVQQNAALITTQTGEVIPIFYFDPADYAVAGLNVKLRLRLTLLTNATAPACTFTLGLNACTASAGASGGFTPTFSASTGSTAAIAAPAASSRNQAASAVFTAPAAGYYALTLLTSAGMAANAWVNVHGRLQVEAA